MQPRILQRFFLSMIVSISLICLILGGLYLLVNYEPAAYQPVVLNAQKSVETRHEADLTAADFYNSVHELKPFIIRINEDFVNRLLLHEDTRALLAAMPGYGRGFVKDPQVRFSQGIITIMAMLTLDDFHSIASFDIAVTIEPSAGNMLVVLKSVRAGAMPLPQKIILNKLSSRLAAELTPPDSPRPADGQADTSSFWVQEQVLPALKDLCDYQRVLFNPEVLVDSGRAVRIVGIRVEQGGLELEIEPIVTE